MICIYNKLKFIFSILIIFISTNSVNSQSLFNNVNFKGNRSHTFDVQSILIELKFDEPNKKVIGVVEHSINSLSTNLSKIELDIAENMKISGVWVDELMTSYDRNDGKLIIKFPKSKRYLQNFKLKIYYDVIPKKGMYFIQPDSLNPKQRRQIWTQGEAEDNHYWLPMYDYPNDRFTVEVKATVNIDQKVLSNGELISTKDNLDGTVTWQWKMDKPIPGYLIMLAIGDYLVTKDTVNNLPLEYWSYKDMPEKVQTTFKHTPDIINYFEKLTGVKFPWNKYAQVFIAEFMFGGMENTTATTLNDNSLVDSYGLIDNNPDGLIAHEAAHQWFGNLIINRSWGHLWLHESFATYLSSLFMGFKYSKDDLIMDMYNQRLGSINTDESQGRDPIVNGKGITPNIYGRGSRILWMLNTLIGEELFWKSINHFLKKHEYSLVETNDLKIAFEETTGENLDWFFNQWVYKAGFPEYSVSYNVKDDTLNLNVKQIQKQDSICGLFKMPVSIEIYSNDNWMSESEIGGAKLVNSNIGVTIDTIWVTTVDSTYKFKINSKPRFVIFDGGDLVMKKINFSRTQNELVAQMCYAPRFLDRLMAVKELEKKYPDTNSSQKNWMWTMTLDSIYKFEKNSYVKIAMIEAMKKSRSNVANNILISGLTDSNRDVRKSAVGVAERITDKKLLSSILRGMLNDSSYSLRASTLSLLSNYDTTGLSVYLLKMKGVKGRRGRFANAWLSAVSDGKFKQMINDVIDYTKHDYSDWTRANAYETIGKLDTINSKVIETLKLGILDKNTFVCDEALKTSKLLKNNELLNYIIELKKTADKDLFDRIEKIMYPVVKDSDVNNSVDNNSVNSKLNENKKKENKVIVKTVKKIQLKGKK